MTVLPSLLRIEKESCAQMLVCEHTVLLTTTLHATPERKGLVMLSLKKVSKKEFHSTFNFHIMEVSVLFMVPEAWMLLVEALGELKSTKLRSTNTIPANLML